MTSKLKTLRSRQLALLGDHVKTFRLQFTDITVKTWLFCSVQNCLMLSTVSHSLQRSTLVECLKTPALRRTKSVQIRYFILSLHITRWIQALLDIFGQNTILMLHEADGTSLSSGELNWKSLQGQYGDLILVLSLLLLWIKCVTSARLLSDILLSLWNTTVILLKCRRPKIYKVKISFSGWTVSLRLLRIYQLRPLLFSPKSPRHHCLPCHISFFLFLLWTLVRLQNT